MECYLDNSATTAVSPEAAALALHIMTEEYGNPSSLHRRGFLAERAMTEARGQVAAVLHCRPEEIIFTAGGTESNNIALLGAARAMKRRGNRIVTTAVEHHSVLAICKALENEGFEVITVAPDESGHITPAAMAAACNEKTILASCMMVNSETGAIHDLPAIAGIAHAHGCKLVVDNTFATAAVARPLTGALYIAKGTRLLPPLYGSGQEKGLRPGTENVPGIAAMGLAAQLMNDRCAENFAHFTALRQRMITNLSQSPAVCINSPADAAPYIVNCSVQGIRSEVMIHYLEQFGIYVSSGSACAKGERSHVLTAMGLSRDRIDSAVRVSMTDTTTPEEIDEFCRRLLEGEATLTKRR